jgi:uncharacterized membrane protein YkoI
MAKGATGKPKAWNMSGFRRGKKNLMAKGGTDKPEAAATPQISAKNAFRSLRGFKRRKAAATPQISAKDAVIAASKYFTEVTGITSGVSVEELELTEDGKNWIVTLGYLEYTGIIPIMQRRQDMIYKTFKVDARTGAVMSMKIREL